MEVDVGRSRKTKCLGTAVVGKPLRLQNSELNKHCGYVTQIAVLNRRRSIISISSFLNIIRCFQNVPTSILYTDLLIKKTHLYLNYFMRF